MKLFLIAGEPSGDRLGAALMAGLKSINPDVEFAGVGGPAMEAEGLSSLFPMHELSVMGLTEVLPKLRSLFRRRDQAAGALLASGADALITIDSPDFCLRVAKKAKAAGFAKPVIHYVAPSVWVWRPGRATKMARHVDHVLALLPFEPPYMEAAGMTCDFVGHPVVAEPQATEAEVAALRDALGLGAARTLVVLPGSRNGEVGRLGEIFGEAVAKVATPDMRVVVPVTANVADHVADVTAIWDVDVTLLDPRGLPPHEAEARKRAAFAMADAALAASGTVGLELAMAGCPGVIAYRMAPITTFLVKRMVKVRFVNLVNLLLDRGVVPEVLLDDCTPQTIANALKPVLDDPAAREDQRNGMAQAMQMLGQGGEAPGLRAARSVLGAIERHG
ncbi:lipid-A-disaccharide synthase [Pontivivens insulae]|uniref:Lipid-A-disaccharide synthase n=1 Tax=Pontivivens insulae TaxID=1639689 RepID=A0A2R8AB76_9RHOB|nr:lipid-A-disaccharide synthase [Pontivivens insulae]RED13218.1 lipid-A-disaccharide synthase [Pontivivens insulae]SPF29310.1 Lipid-A-disaccharide synthase [Pontivivens insulae]